MTNQTIIEDLTLIPPPPWWGNPWVWIGPVVFAGALYCLWRLYGRGEPFAPLAEAPSGPPPEEEALRLLAALKARHGRMTAYEVSVECSEILRSYLEASLGLPVLCQTTREFLAGAQAALPAQWRGMLEAFLEFFDEVKFARETASTNKMLATIEACEQFVRDFSAGNLPAPKE